MSTNIVPISDLRREASRVVNTVREGSDVVYITQHGRPAAVLVDYEQYEVMLEQLEDLADIISIKQAANEPERDYEAFLAEMTAAADPSDDLQTDH